MANNINPNYEFHLLLKGLGYIRTHWWIYFIEIIIIYGSALNNFSNTIPQYESVASILIDNSRKQMYQTFMLSNMNANNSTRKQNLAHLLTSQDVIERLRIQLTEHYNVEGRPAHLRFFFRGTQALSSNELRSWLSLSYDKNSDIYTFTCRAENPDAAHDLCLIYMNTIQAYYPEVGQRESMMKRDFLIRQISMLTRQIAEREFQLTDFQKKSPDFINYLVIEVEEKGKIKLRNELTVIRDQLLANRTMKNLLLTSPTAKRGEHSYTSAAIQSASLRINELQYQLRLMEESNASDKEQRKTIIQNEITDVSARLAKLNDEEVSNFIKNPMPAQEVRNQLAKLEMEYRVNTIKQKNLERKLEDISMREKKYQQQRLEYEKLKTELLNRKKLLNSLYNKEQETELELSAGNAEVFRLQEPTRNTNKVAPLLSRYLYGSLSICIFLLLITTILLMALFPRIDNENEVTRLNIPIVGKVPIIRKYHTRLAEVPGISLEYLKIMNYRLLRETKEIRCPIIVISSAHAKEGKSTIAQLLALASKGPNRKALLIDGDLLTNHVNTFFDIPEDRGPGLRTILNTPFDSTPEIDLSTIIFQTPHEGIFFMPRGKRLDPVSTPHFLRPVERVLANLRKEYDAIFVDTPPLFASNLAHQWTGIADLVIVVGRLFVTRPKDLLEAVQTCKIFSKAPVGVALNCVPISGVDRRVSNYYFSKRKSTTIKMAS